jgi:malate dehydrogenase (oxaloacetate-decarboxylating)
LLPPVGELRRVAEAVARAVALQAGNDGVAPALSADEVAARVAAAMWTPKYRPYRRAAY